MSDFLQKFWFDKTVLITGASSGLGWAVTEALAPYRVHFGLLSRRQERMEELVLKLRGSGSSFWFKPCDVRNRNEIETAIRQFHQQTNCLDVVWVNSGIGGKTAFADWNWDQYQDMIDTNLNGAIYTILAALRIMAKQGSGHVVGIGSAASMRGLPQHAVYSLTKISLRYFIEAMATELPQINFTVIHPGFVDTPINQGNPNRIFLQQPEKAARLMIKAVAKRKWHYIYPLPMKWIYHLGRVLPMSFYLWLLKQPMIANKY